MCAVLVLAKRFACCQIAYTHTLPNEHAHLTGSQASCQAFQALPQGLVEGILPARSLLPLLSRSERIALLLTAAGKLALAELRKQLPAHCAWNSHCLPP